MPMFIAASTPLPAQEKVGTSTHWLSTESLRILALTGLQLTTRPADASEILTLQEQAMLRVGGALRAA
jgi:hypothetical protein